MFVYPLVVIGVYAFNGNISPDVADRELHDEVVRRGLAGRRCPRRALAVHAGGAGRDRDRPRALALGTLASLAVFRDAFFGRETISFLVLPIALPGIVTGLALQATILNVLDPIGIRSAS